jgi:hypothetical protein
VVFIFAGLITWPQVILMSVGGSMGGYFIARFARKIPSQIIHWLVSIVAISMTTYFFIKG